MRISDWSSDVCSSDLAFGHHRHAMLPYTARRHAAMGGLDNNGNAPRLQRVLQRRRDLAGEALLELQPPGEGIDQPRQFRDADDAAIGPVGDMGLADDRRQMMLAGGDQRDGAEIGRAAWRERVGEY